MRQRAQSFGTEAASYDAVRPGYPDSVIDRIVDGSPALVVDAGCGTGIAAAQVAARGIRVVGVEPDARMAAVAANRGVEVIVASFEEWVSVERCDVVMTAQTWHWIDAYAGANAAARAIRPGGRLAARREVFDALVDAFGANATLDVRYETEMFTALRA